MITHGSTGNMSVRRARTARDPSSWARTDPAAGTREPRDGSMGRLDGKVALISGAARGQGEAEARAFVAEGARVVLGDVLDDLGAAVAADLGDTARYVHLDVRREDDWGKAVAAVLEAFGRLNVLVNNAGI